MVASGEACIGRSKSQFNEEQTLIDKFGWAEKYDGVYVEIGALDGYRLSNTLQPGRHITAKQTRLNPPPGTAV